MSNKPNYKTSRKYKCPYCDKKDSRGNLVDHVEHVHQELIPEGYTAARAVFDFINGKDHGICMICKKPVYEWNDKINRYYNLCDNPNCRAKVREIALARHMKVYNKPTLLNDPEQQEKMLANRRISGKYTFSDGTKMTYTGKYERNALEFMDKVLGIPAKDIQAPGPVLEYEFEGQTHRWITDIYYIPANLLIEIKDGGENPNTRTMTSYRAKQDAKEVMITNLGKFNYIRLTDNNFAQLLNIFADMKEEALSNDKNPKVKIHINESSSKLDNDYKPKGNISLSSLKKVHITKEIIDNYEKDYPCLKHVRCKDTKDYTCDGYMWMDNNKLACMVGSCEYTDDHTKWIVSLVVTKEYKGYGLSKQVLDYAVKYMDCKYLSVNKNNQIAKHIYDKYGFKVYEESDTMYYMHYGADEVIKEEVGGLPPQRAPEAYIIPYGMNNIFSGFAYGDDSIDKILTIEDDGNILPMVESVFYEKFDTAPKLYYREPDIEEKIDNIHNDLQDQERREFDKFYFVETLIGHKLNKPEDVAMSESFRYYDKAEQDKICSLIENGITVSNPNNYAFSNVIKTVGNILIHQTDNGFYASTPDSFYMASDYFQDLQSLESSGIIEFMDKVFQSNMLQKVYNSDRKENEDE